MKTSQRNLGLLALVTFFALACGCNKNINANSNKAFMEVTNAAPGTPPIYITFNNGPLGQDTSGVPFDSTTGVPGDHYLTAVAGIHSLQIHSGLTTYINGNTALSNNTYYSMFAYDTAPTSGVKVLILQDEFSLPPDTAALVRFLNLSPDTTNYALLFTNAVDTFYFGFVPFVGPRPSTGNLSPFSHPPITQGSYGVIAYIDSVSQSASQKKLDSVTIFGGKMYSIYTTGLIGAPIDSLSVHLLQHN
jgi:Domain of unknown function (DUF4397)